MTLHQFTLRARTIDWGRTLVSTFLLAAVFGVSFVLGRGAGRLTRQAYDLLSASKPEVKFVSDWSGACDLAPFEAVRNITAACSLLSAPGDGRIRIAGRGGSGVRSSRFVAGGPQTVVRDPSPAAQSRAGHPQGREWGIGPSGGPVGLAGAGLQGAPAVPLATALEGQVTALVLGVDDLGADKPMLEAVWLIVYRPPASRAFVLGLSPETAVSLGDGRAMRLSDAFAQADGKPRNGDPFWAVLRALAPATPTVIVRLDREGLARLLEFSGGAMIAQARLSPDQAVAWLERRRQAGPLEGLEAQAELLRGVLEAASTLNWAADGARVLQSLSGHLEASAPAERLLQLAAPLLPLESVDVYVQAAGGRVTTDGWVIVEK